jgi:hypothetical protein
MKPTAIAALWMGSHEVALPALGRGEWFRHIAALQFVDVGRLELAAELTAAGPSGLLWKELGVVTLLFVE